ncbi:uncharacterized protein KIAA2026-like [Pollicipes pollicipes]|uniref:uncharacterized protein KIAA2026-like n=1 Tax=Pollicipes pollicipes TaxID=41117 RepID=UPI00188580C9|nr:uncharacterized protein KIAA2026-like [Pollicipes pollicipes]
MWEFPQLAQFVHLSLRALNILEVPLYEMERMLLVPQSSETLAMLMTSLVSSPLVRMKLADLPPMPYHMWTAKLAARVQLWYRAYARERGCTQRLLETQGIEPTFWQVVGTSNPFEKRLFHQLSFYERVWMVKTMCDFLFHSHKSLQDCVMEAATAEPRETVVGRDRHGFEYLHFPQLLVRDVRLYRRGRLSGSRTGSTTPSTPVKPADPPDEDTRMSAADEDSRQWDDEDSRMSDENESRMSVASDEDSRVTNMDGEDSVSHLLEDGEKPAPVKAPPTPPAACHTA